MAFKLFGMEFGNKEQTGVEHPAEVAPAVIDLTESIPNSRVVAPDSLSQENSESIMVQQQTADTSSPSIEQAKAELAEAGIQVVEPTPEAVNSETASSVAEAVSGNQSLIDHQPTEASPSVGDDSANNLGQAEPVQ